MTATRTVLARVTPEPLNVEEHAAAVSSPTCGAVVTFVGAVRDHDGGRGVEYLEYEAHPDAAAALDQILKDLADDVEVDAIAVSHRFGVLQIGEAAIVVAVAAAHRAEAFAACARVVDQVKAELPVWKRQVFTDGTDEWVNSA
jgi:molybdopterin synthase catalytic subunit